MHKFVIRDGDSEVTVAVTRPYGANRTALVVQDLPSAAITVDKHPSPIVAAWRDNFTIFFLVNGNTTKYSLRASAMFRGLNPELSQSFVEINSYRREGMRIESVNISENQWNVSVEIENSYSTFGGILTLQLHIRPSRYNLQEALVYNTEYSKEYEIYSDVYENGETNVVIPGDQTLAHLSSITWLQMPRQAIICKAIGNPRPDVVLTNLTKFNEQDVLSPVRVVENEYITEKAYILPLNKSGTEGKYACRYVYIFGRMKVCHI